MTVAGYSTTIKFEGSPVVMTGEACSALDSKTYHVTNSAKRIIDPDTAVVVKDGGSTVNAANYSVDPMFGVVYFDNAPAGTVTMDAAYIPTVPFIAVRSYDIKLKRNVIDSTTNDSAGYTERTPGLIDMEGTIKMLSLLYDDQDPSGTNAFVLEDIFAAQTPFVLEIRSGATGSYLRAWVVLSQVETTGAAQEMLETSITVNLSQRPMVGRTTRARIAWGQ